MILQALCACYERLLDDPDSRIAPLGWSAQKLSFRVVLNRDGSLHQIEDIRDHHHSFPTPRLLLAPGGSKPPGAGLNPGFLWDNPAYLLGHRANDPHPERTRQAFEAFREKHLRLEGEIDDLEFSLVCRFLRNWNPAEDASRLALNEIASGLGVFRIYGSDRHVHERLAVQRWWQSDFSARMSADATSRRQCLVTGHCEPVARLHEPKIVGFADAPSVGSVLVSFNSSVVESYGKHQGENAPVGWASAFQYCTALNHLVRKGSRNCVHAGGVHWVFWSEKQCGMEPLLRQALSGSLDEERLGDSEAGQEMELPRGLLKSSGDDTQCFLLGLASHALRLSVRYWNVSSLNTIRLRLSQHYEAFHLARSTGEPSAFPSLQRILQELSGDQETSTPLLAVSIVQAMFSDAPYPADLSSRVLARIRADGVLSSLRAGMVKACLNDRLRLGDGTWRQTLGAALDEAHPAPAYHLGRLFTALHCISVSGSAGLPEFPSRQHLLGKAMRSPSTVFPGLMRLSSLSLCRLEKQDREESELLLQQIVGCIDEFPSQLGLIDQGLFIVGAAHQSQSCSIRNASGLDFVMTSGSDS